MKNNDYNRAARDTLMCVFHREAWSDIAFGLLMLSVGVLFVAFRVVMLVLFPITVPLLVWARRPAPYKAKGADE